MAGVIHRAARRQKPNTIGTSTPGVKSKRTWGRKNELSDMRPYNPTPWRKNGEPSKMRVINNIDPKSRDYLYLERIRDLEKKLLHVRLPEKRLEYVKNLAKEKHALWNCYSKLIIKMKFELIKLCNDYKFDLTHEIESYEAMAYEKYERVVEKIDMDKWEHLKSKALIHCSLWGYLRSMNRDIVGKHIMDGSNTTQIKQKIGKPDDSNSTVTNLDVYCAEHFQSTEDRTYLGIVRRVFNETMKALEAQMKPRQLAVWEMKKEDATATAICEKYGIKPKDLKEFITSCKDEFKRLVPKVSKTLGNEMSYEEMTEELTA